MSQISLFPGLDALAESALKQASGYPSSAPAWTIEHLEEELRTERHRRKGAEEALQAAQAENHALHARLKQRTVCRGPAAVRSHRDRLVGQSYALRTALAQVESVAATETPVLLVGETGTGKEMLAQAVHKLSRRSERPMVTVNCATLPPTLVEGELFGHEAGAYTGAISRRIGRFEAAHGATLFLDEVGELSPELQVKLLRVLEDGSLERLGSSKTLSVDVRIIAATNRDLSRAMAEGRFRTDLYHRLHVFPIRVPPLRERRDDIPLLVREFVEEFGRRMGKTVNTIPQRDMDRLQQYPWPGNVRELSNVIERAMVLATGSVLHVQLTALGPTGGRSRMTLEELERTHILKVLEDTMWRVRGANGAAEILGVKPTTLEARMIKLGIRRSQRPTVAPQQDSAQHLV